MSRSSIIRSIAFLGLVSLTVCTASAQSVQLRGSIIEIVGTSRSDSVRVTRSYGTSRSSYDDQIVVYPNSRSRRVAPVKIPLYRYVSRRYRRQVTSLSFKGQRGDDTFVNDTSLPSIASGGDGDDTLIGGSGADKFYGEDGCDTLRGKGGDDTLYGGEDSDFLDGGAGKDVMLGRDKWIEGQSSGDTEPQSDIPGHYDKFVDDFDLSKPIKDGLSFMDVDQARSHSCTILSSLASAANMGINLGDRIFQDPRNPTRFTVLLFGTNGKSIIPVDVTFDGSWNSNDAQPTRERGYNGRPTGAMTGEFWALLYQRAYLTAYIDNWTDPDPANWKRPGSTAGAWGRRGHALQAIVGGMNIGSWDWTNDTTAAPLPEELQFAMNEGIVMTTRVSGHIVALLDVYKDPNGQWQVLIYNQRALDNYESRGAQPDGQSDGVMLFEWHRYLESFNVVTPYDPIQF